MQAYQIKLVFDLYYERSWFSSGTSIYMHSDFHYQ